MPRYIVKDYLGCTRCPLHQFRRNIVFGRGSLPAKVFFVGESNTKAEDLIGVPLIGSSGRLLEAGIKLAAGFLGKEPPTYFISNVCACRPTDTKGGENRPPTGEEAWACWARLEKTYRDVNPQKVVLLGDTAKKFCKRAWSDATCLLHPAAILRAGGEESPVFRNFARNLSEVFRNVLD